LLFSLIKVVSGEFNLRLKDDQISRLADKILGDLSAAGLITLKKERGTLLSAIRNAIQQDMAQEDTLTRDAERILDESLRAMGSGAAGIDRHKMLLMIKQKLAKERKIVL